MTLEIYTVLINESEKHILSFMPHKEAFQSGLPNSAMIGYVKDPHLLLSSENIQYNPGFLTLFHKVVKETSIKSKQLAEAALRQKTGFIYIIDLRDKNFPNTQSQDIIGCFELSEGLILEDTYLSNPYYQLFSKDGIFVLPDDYMQNLKKAMFG